MRITLPADITAGRPRPTQTSQQINIDSVFLAFSRCLFFFSYFRIHPPRRTETAAKRHNVTINNVQPSPVFMVTFESTSRIAKRQGLSIGAPRPGLIQGVDYCAFIVSTGQTTMGPTAHHQIWGTPVPVALSLLMNCLYSCALQPSHIFSP